MCCNHPPACDHMFAYWSVAPPSHCIKCGACLTCGQPRSGVKWTITTTGADTTTVSPAEFARRARYASSVA